MDRFWEFAFTAAIFFTLGFVAKGWLEEGRKHAAADDERKQLAKEIMRSVGP